MFRQTQDSRYIVRMVGYTSPSPKGAENNVLEIQTLHGTVESKTEVNVFIQELGTSLSFKLVNDSPSDLSSER